MSLAGANVVAIETAVETDRLGEQLDTVVGRAIEATAPGFLAHRKNNHRGTENTEKKQEKTELDDIAFDSLFQDRDVEIDHQADAGLAQTQVADELGFVNRQYLFDCLEFDNETPLEKE